jgi:hypothetical protein
MSGKAYYYTEGDVEASPSSQNNYSTAFSMPPAKTQREIELDQREMELKLREERVCLQKSLYFSSLKSTIHFMQFQKNVNSWQIKKNKSENTIRPISLPASPLSTTTLKKTFLKTVAG